MIIRSFLTLWAGIQLGLAANIAARQRHELTLSECAAKGGECDETRGRPVCGTDDVTYPTRCHLLRVQCSGHQVSLKYRGPCKACKEARDYALRHKSKNPPKFIPRCKADGTYAAIQCLGETGCWCSDITGKPIENTSVRVGKPKCREYSKNNLRRSPPRHIGPGRNRRTCTVSDRVAFNANLIKVFQSEYVRAGQLGAAGLRSDKTVLNWKFSKLDANENQMLDKNEFRELKKLIKRAVKPRRCGRAFGKYCDLDNDDRLTHSEWNSCFRDDFNPGHTADEHRNNAVNTTSISSAINNNNNNRHSSTQGIKQYSGNNIPSNKHNENNNNNNNNNIQHNTFSRLDELENKSNAEDDDGVMTPFDYDDDADYDPDESNDGDSSSMLHTFGSSTVYPSIYFLRPKSDSPLKETEGEYDCLADRAATLEEQRQGTTPLYVPECTSDGRYQRIQCYQSTPYCWCVHEDTGKNIPNTTVKFRKPQCDQINTVPRAMKGCSEPRKTAFLHDLKEFLKTYIAASANAGGNITKWNSEDERIATLSFLLLDKNKNKAWERREWKTFRELVTNSKTLRKCGKKMPRYCDVDGDKKITHSEWLSCLQAQRIDIKPATQSTTASNESVTTRASKLTGSNPLEQYLKD